jgi:uncharacterized protein (DUF1330 family)
MIMNINTVIAVALLASIAASAGFVGGLRAQGKSQHAYFIAESVVTNPEEDAKVMARLGTTGAASGGRYLVRGGAIAAYEGEPPKRILIVEFDSLDKIRAWRDLPKVKELETARQQVGTTLRLYAVEGIAE